MPADFPVTVNAVSGYSGGGKSMIQSHESGTAPAFELYGLALEHKHVPELQLYSKLTRRPIFVPSVGNFYKGMLISIPLHLDTLPGKPIARDLETALMRHYAGGGLVEVVAAADPSAKGGRLEPEALNGTNQLELRVFAHPAAAAGGAGRAAGQSRQGRVRRRGPEPRPDARNGDLELDRLRCERWRAHRERQIKL